MATRGTTRDVRIDHDRCLVVKRFRSRHRGGPAREWAALTLLAGSAPGLAPAPVRADLDADPPAIVMSLLPGSPLGTAPPLCSAQAGALAIALQRLWRSVPPARVTACMGSALTCAALTRQVRAMLSMRYSLGDDRFELTGPELARLREPRRLAALFWLILLRPGGPASGRNPPGTPQRQASRLLALLG